MLTLTLLLTRVTGDWQVSLVANLVALALCELVAEAGIVRLLVGVARGGR
jgi:hypothetical protein